LPVPSNAVDKLIDKVKNNVGRSDDSTMDDYAIEWINEAQKKVCNKANFWFLHTTTTIAFTSGDNVEDLPSDFKDDALVFLEVTTGSTTDWEELDYAEWIDIRRDYDATTTGQPQHYIIEGDELYLYPIPNDSYTVRLDYYKYLADLAASGSSNNLLDNYPEILEAYATHKAFSRLREFEESAAWEGKFNRELRDLVLANAEREVPDEMVLRTRPDVFATGLRKPRGRIG